MLDSIRYGVALVMLMMTPGAVLFWYLVHPFIAFWRSVGPTVTYSVTFSLMGVTAYGIYRLREPLLAEEYGTHPLLWALAAATYLAGVVIEVQCRRHLTFHMLVGMPELRPASGGKLLTEGIYGRIRHPRYVSVTLIVFAVAFFTNYLAMYVMAVLFVPAIWFVAIFEERELGIRFGGDYEAYSETVPRFIPRAGRRAGAP